MTNQHKLTYKKLETGWHVTSELDLDGEYSQTILEPTFNESMGDLICLKESKGYRVQSPSEPERKVRKSSERKVAGYDHQGKRFYAFRNDPRFKSGQLKRMTKKHADKLKAIHAEKSMGSVIFQNPHI